MNASDIAERYAEILDRVATAAQRVGRQPDEISLVAVTKTWPAEVVAAAYKTGMRHFGENRIEELAAKKSAVVNILGREKDDLIWHQIGTLQSRKTTLAADHADVFHALDRLKIAKRLSSSLHENGRLLPTFIEVNISQEISKSGFDCSTWEENATVRDNIRTVVETVAGLPGLSLQGLMTMAPWGADKGVIRQVFRRTRLLAKWLDQAVPQANLTKLSMGMTDDFEIAVEEGATHIRVGRAIFGPRP
jgi:pyridoxal phosphate enzyme (YggS family)